MTRVGDGQELVAAYEEAARAGMKVMVQELIQGGDECGVNYNCLMIEGEPIVEFTAEKVRLSPPTFGVPRVVISKRIPEIIEPGRAILRGLGFQGFACTEFKRDVRTGTYQFMEVNGRHNRSGMLAVSCGINFPLLEYEFLAYGKSPKPASFREGVYWIDDVKDFVESFRHRAVERYSWRQLARPYFQPHVYAVWDWRDPKPLLKRCRDLMLAAGNGRREKASSSAA
jgi:predicted ATP-grasp superfamily ATP-dependent carboligase